MNGSIIARRWRTYALSLALGLAAAANLAPVALAADSAESPVQRQEFHKQYSFYLIALPADSTKSQVARPTDKYLDPKTGINLPDSPLNHD